LLLRLASILKAILSEAGPTIEMALVPATGCAMREMLRFLGGGTQDAHKKIPEVRLS